VLLKTAKAKSIFFMVLLLLVVVSIPSRPAQGQRGVANRTAATMKGKPCNKLYATETNLMCLPGSKGKGLTWQKYPVEQKTCARLGVVAKPAGLTCKKYSYWFARAYASPLWISAPGPFRYFTIYGNSWQPRVGRECATHNAVVEWEAYQSQWIGEASCLLNSTGTAWTWQQKAQLQKSCARINAQWGDLICKKSGARKLWKKAPKITGATQMTFDSVVKEARLLFGNFTSMGWEHFNDQYATYNNGSIGFSYSMIRELQLRASLSGINIGTEIWTAKFFVVSWSGGQRCFLLRDTGSYRNIEDDMGSMYNGSIADVPEVSCDAEEDVVLLKAATQVKEIDSALWLTGDVSAWRAAVLNLGSSPDLVVRKWKKLSKFDIEVDDSSSLERVRVAAGITMNRAVSPATATSTSYEVSYGSSNCYRTVSPGKTDPAVVVRCG
jgi:hypothetical protein